MTDSTDPTRISIDLPFEVADALDTLLMNGDLTRVIEGLEEGMSGPRLERFSQAIDDLPHMVYEQMIWHMDKFYLRDETNSSWTPPAVRRNEG